MYGHMDKQPPLDGYWSEGLGPWTPVEKDDKLYGRGSSDDGYAFFLAALIAKSLVKFGLNKNNINIFIESDEESESKDIMFFLEKYEKQIGTPDLIICLDSGTVDFEYFTNTTSLRGFVETTMKVSILKSS